MSLKAKVMGVGIFAGILMAGLAPTASATPDPVQIVMDRVDTQVRGRVLDPVARTIKGVDRPVDYAIAALERAIPGLDIDIRF